LEIRGRILPLKSETQRLKKKKKKAVTKRSMTRTPLNESGGRIRGLERMVGAVERGSRSRSRQGRGGLIYSSNKKTRNSLKKHKEGKSSRNHYSRAALGRGK